MISVRIKGAERIESFSLSGHGTDSTKDIEGKIVCAAVSSAVYMAANTLSEIVGAEIEAKDDGDVLSVRVLSKLEESQITLQGLKLHLEELSKDYNKKITIISEV